MIRNTQISGDPMEPCDHDLIAQAVSLPADDPAPDGSGWRCLYGVNFNEWVRVEYRMNITGKNR